MDVGLCQVVDGPLEKGGRDGAPRAAKPLDQELRIVGGHGVFHYMAVAVAVREPQGNGRLEQVGAGSVQTGEPGDAAKGDVADDFAEGTHVGGGPELKLSDCERMDGVFEAGLISFPLFEDAGKIKLSSSVSGVAAMMSELCSNIYTGLLTEKRAIAYL